MGRRTTYTDTYIKQLVEEFITSFRADKRPFSLKLNGISIAKATFSRLLAGGKPNKRTIESMRAFLENRTPKHMQVGPGQFYCSGCEDIFDEKMRYDAWYCKACQKEGADLCDQKNYKSRLARKYAWRIRNRKNWLQGRRDLHLRNVYGEFANCVALVKQISLQIKLKREADKLNEQIEKDISLNKV